MCAIDEIAYDLKRAAEERTAAATATDPAIRDPHIVMAGRYADRASSKREEDFPAIQNSLRGIGR